MKMVNLTFLLLAVMVFCPFTISSAATRDLDIRVGLDLRYDDNVFQYSDKNLDQFGTGPKFSGLVSEVDWIMIPSLKVGYRFRHPYDTRLSFEVEPKFHEKNTFRNYLVYTARIRQELPSQLEGSLRYLLVPRFFLRPLADPPNQTTTYADADFKLQSFKLSLDKTWSRWFTGEISGLYERKDYNSDFDERDTTVVGEGVEARLRLNRTFQVVLGTDYEQGRARGENDASINSDISYNQWSVHVSPTVQLAAWLTANLGYTYESKHFTTDLNADTNHVDRDDVTQTTEIELKTRLTKRLDAHIGYERIDRTSDRQGADIEFASFTENRFTMGILFEFY